MVLAETSQHSGSIPGCLVSNLDTTSRCEPSWRTEMVRLAAIAEAEATRFVDLRALSCTGERCPVITEDTLIYADANHITVAFSRARGPWVTSLIRDVLENRARRVQ